MSSDVELLSDDDSSPPIAATVEVSTGKLSRKRGPAARHPVWAYFDHNETGKRKNCKC